VEILYQSRNKHELFIPDTLGDSFRIKCVNNSWIQLNECMNKISSLMHYVR